VIKSDLRVQVCGLFIVFVMLSGCVVYTEPVQTRNYPPPQTVVESQPPQYYQEPEIVVEDLPSLSAHVSVTIAPPIIINEPVYYTPPIVVAYPYNYFFYTTDPSGYVNIVFVDANNRRHYENWYVNGARMRHDRLDAWRRNYKINAREYDRHRMQVNEHRNVRRSPEYKRQKPSPPLSSPTGHHPEPPYVKPQPDRQPPKIYKDQNPQSPQLKPQHDQLPPKPDHNQRPEPPNTRSHDDHQQPKVIQDQKPEPYRGRPQYENQPAKLDKHQQPAPKVNNVPKQVEQKEGPPQKKIAPGQQKKEHEIKKDKKDNKDRDKDN
jgi:hypothetical protein